MAELKKFHERFDISVGDAEAKRRFVNRFYNNFLELVRYDSLGRDRPDAEDVMKAVASGLGERHVQIGYTSQLEQYVKEDFHRCLQALEVLFRLFSSGRDEQRLTEIIGGLLTESERDLGIRWEKGTFIPAGAKLLDEHLVNDPLEWLRDHPAFGEVLTSFENGLHHFVEAQKKPNVLPDVITNVYKALEALAKIITERPTRDLSANRELFITKIKAPESYKKILKEYIEYANEVARHAATGVPQPPPSIAEVESFIYLTGLFIRMAIQPVTGTS